MSQVTEQLAVNARSTLNGAITSGATTLVVNSATPFPLAPQFRIIVDSEIMLVTGVSGTTFTVSRGLEGTTGTSHNDNSPVSLILTPAAFRNTQPKVCEGRLTLTSGTPVTTTDVTGATSIYFTPYLGNRVSLYNGTDWVTDTFTEVTIPVGTVTSGLPYDLFAYDSGGTVLFDTPVAWTNGTTRATALTTQDGIYVKSGTLTRRYVGTFYSTSTTQTEDSEAKRFLWNYYNRLPRSLERVETATTWAVNTNSAWEQANSNAANKVEVVIGVSETPIEILVTVVAVNETGLSAGNSAVGIGLNSTTTLWSSCRIGWMYTGPIGNAGSSVGHAIGFLPVGYNYLAWLEATQNTSNITFAGTSSPSPGQLQIRSGLVGHIHA